MLANRIYTCGVLQPHARYDADTTNAVRARLLNKATVGEVSVSKSIYTRNITELISCLLLSRSTLFFDVAVTYGERELA